VRVSPGCERCYAETFSKRVGLQVWGAQADRRFFGDKHWSEPVKWNREAQKAGKRARVFCASMADVFEYSRGPAGLKMIQERVRLFGIIEATPWLDWLLLTKRPENVNAMVPERWLREGFPPNVWIGTTVEDQPRAEQRISELLKIPARVRFLSVEPQLELVRLTKIVDDELGASWNALEMGISWVICGGESGPKARPFDVSWARSLLEECRAHGVPFFMKQLGSHAIVEAPGLQRFSTMRATETTHVRFATKHSKGEDMDEWPADLRVQEWPA
jgi:protein gp37